jgi:hypothetical protein
MLADIPHWKSQNSNPKPGLGLAQYQLRGNTDRLEKTLGIGLLAYWTDFSELYGHTMLPSVPMSYGSI